MATAIYVLSLVVLVLFLVFLTFLIEYSKESDGMKQKIKQLESTLKLTTNHLAEAQAEKDELLADLTALMNKHKG